MPTIYCQSSKRLAKIRPFFRYQYVNANPNSIYHDDVLLRHGPSFGTRYDFTESVEFETQLDHTIRKGLPNLNGVRAQLSFRFLNFHAFLQNKIGGKISGGWDLRFAGRCRAAFSFVRD